MKAIEDLNLPEDRKYSNEHVWIKKDADSYLLGISDFAQDQLGEIVFIEMPDTDTDLEANGEFGTVESVKSVNKLFMPIAGTITEVNSPVEDDPALLNANSYENWIARITASDATAYDALMDAQAYRAFLNK